MSSAAGRHGASGGTAIGITYDQDPMGCDSIVYDIGRDDRADQFEAGGLRRHHAHGAGAPPKIVTARVTRFGEARHPGPPLPDDQPHRGDAHDDARHIAPPARRGLRLNCGNSTGWGAAKDWLATCKADVLFIQEHKRRHAEDVAEASGVALRHGWKSLWAPAVGSGTEADEASGGTAIFVRKHLGLLLAPGDLDASVVDGHLTAGLLEAGSTGGIVAYTPYLVQGDELGARNWATLTAWASHIAGHGRQWIAGGDWNVEPETLRASGWLRKVGGVLVVPPVTSTVRMGDREGRLIDYWVISKGLVAAFTDGGAVGVVGDAPIRTHTAISLCLNAAPRRFDVTRMIGANAYPRDRPIGPACEPKVDLGLCGALARAAADLAIEDGDIAGAATARDRATVLWLRRAEAELDGRYHVESLDARAAAQLHGRDEGVHFVRSPLMGPKLGRHASGTPISKRLRMLEDRARDLAAAVRRWCSAGLPALRDVPAIRGPANGPPMNMEATAACRANDVVQRARAAIHAATHVMNCDRHDASTTQSAARLKATARAIERKAKHGPRRTDDRRAMELELRGRASSLDDVAVELEPVAKAAETNRRTEVTRAVKDWCNQATANGAAVAHRWTRVPSEWRPEWVNEADLHGSKRPTASPDAILVAERSKWAAFWAPREGGDIDMPTWTEVPLLERPNVDLYRRAAKSFKKLTGLSAERLHPRDVGEMDDETLECLIDIMMACEALGTMPSATRTVLVYLIDKKTGGRRPIGLLPVLYRIWMKVRRAQIRGWEQEWARVYFTAGRGRSPIDAAWATSLTLGYAGAKGVNSATVLCDMRKCFEHARHRLVAEEARACRFPLTLARLAMAVYRLERRLVIDGHCSDAILPTRGVMAGCSAALALLEVTMVRALDDYIPRHPKVDLEL